MRECFILYLYIYIYIYITYHTNVYVRVNINTYLYKTYVLLYWLVPIYLQKLGRNKEFLGNIIIQTKFQSFVDGISSIRYK